MRYLSRVSTSAAKDGRARIGVFGGTFDPIHAGHLIVATEALHTLALDRMLFVPAGQPPHKPGQVISSDEDRCSMIQAAIDGRSAFQLCEIDLHRPGPSYSVDLLAILQEEYAGSDLFFLIGADSWRDLHTWHEPHRIPAFSTLVVAGRPGVADQGEEILASIPEIGDRLEFIDTPLICLLYTSPSPR